MAVNLSSNDDAATHHPLSNGLFTHPESGYQRYIKINTWMIVSGIAILIYITGYAIREIIQIYQQKWHYLLEPNNCISWLLHLSAIVMVSCLFMGGKIHDHHFSAASMTVFLSWFNLLLFLQRFDQVGIYVVMFLEILQTLVKVLMVFSILIIAFGFAFFILLSNVGGWAGWVFVNAPI